MCCLISMYLQIFQFLPVIEFKIHTIVSERILNIISIFLNLLRLVLWHNVLSWRLFPLHLTECILCCIGWNIFFIPVRFIWSIMLFKSTISLLIFCLDDLSMVENGGIKVPYYYIAIYYSFNSLNMSFIYFSALILGA